MPISNKTDKAGHGPSLLRVLGRSPAARWLSWPAPRVVAGGKLTQADRGLIGLMVAQRSGSPYWLSVQ